jgi:hypothetical protein
VDPEAMVNLVILIVVLLIAFRIIRPLLRLAISMLAKIISFGFFIAMAILLLVAVLSRGAVI